MHIQFKILRTIFLIDFFSLNNIRYVKLPTDKLLFIFSNLSLYNNMTIQAGITSYFDFSSEQIKRSSHRSTRVLSYFYLLAILNDTVKFQDDKVKIINRIIKMYTDTEFFFWEIKKRFFVNITYKLLHYHEISFWKKWTCKTEDWFYSCIQQNNVTILRPKTVQRFSRFCSILLRVKKLFSFHYTSI